MSFAELQIEPEYRSLTTDVAKNFYIPVLKESILYQRAVGFFASSVLAQISEGVESLAENGGKIQLIASPHLQAATRTSENLTWMIFKKSLHILRKIPMEFPSWVCCILAAGLKKLLR